ncbi:hypothetical protein EDD85DRAFT_955103 [Armillaria nabsnona]|nr:hypothetical protein EDD85DRAFT_955103 [Armillaria nabsnona]
MAGRYKSQQAVSDIQAKILYQVKENNEERPVGERLRLEQLQELVKTDPRCDELTDRELQSLKEEIYAKCLDKQQGAQVSHKGAADNYRHTADLIESALIGLGHRTGAHGFAVLSQGSVDDTMAPCLLQIPGSTAFPTTSIKVDPTDFVHQFELFSCTVDDKAHKDQASIRKDMTQLISDGLEAITHVKGVNMNYQNYEKSLVMHHGIKLVGWPEQIPFGSPSNISCRWTRLDETEMEELTESIVSCEVSGEVVGKKRKEWSDKGGLHKKKCKNKDDRPWGQKHARQGAKLSDVGTSHSTQNLDDSESNDGAGDEDEDA